MRLLRILQGIVFSLGLACAPALATNICGPLNGTLTPAGNPYVATCDISVAFGDTLNLDPGVEIRFNDFTALTVDGTLNAKGDAVNGVLFTSNSGAPSPGIWNSVDINGQGTFDYATVRYAMWSTVYGNADFTNCTFEQNWTGVGFDVGSSGSVTGGSFSLNNSGFVVAGDASVTVSGAVFDQNIRAGLMLGPNAYPVLSNLTVNENHTEYNGIVVDTMGGNWSKGGTWTDAGCPYVIEFATLNFDSGATLTLEAGVIIKVKSGPDLYFETLDVNGTDGNPVVFTSLQDDSVGGDTNADDDASSPSPSDWNGPVFNGTGSTLDYATVRYATWTTVYGNADFTNCTFEQNNTGVRFDMGSSGSVTGGSFSFNGSGLGIWGNTSVTASGAVFDQNGTAGYLEGPNVYPALSDLTVNENHAWINGIEVNTMGVYWSASGTWTDAGCPYVFQLSDLNFNSGVTFTLEAGVVIKVDPTISLDLETLDVNGTSGNPVVFTSIKDDSVGGDTNADGGATTPGPGDWFGLTLNGPGSTLDYATVRYAQLSRVYGSAGFANCAFEQNWTGVVFGEGSSGSVTGGSFSFNDTGLVISGDTSVTASGAVFDQNGMAGSLLGLNVYPALSDLTVNENHLLYNGIAVEPAFGSWSTSGTWTDAGCPYVIQNSDLDFNSGVTFTVEAGVVIKVDGVSLNFETLDVNGTSGNPVVFTSINDDSVGGDTNANGGATSPAPLDWSGMTFSGPGSTLDYATVRYADNNTVYWSADFTNCAFEQNWTGVRFMGFSGSVTGSSFSFNNTGFETGGGPPVTISDTVFDQNGVAGSLFGPNAYPALSDLTVNENHGWRNGIVVEPNGIWSTSGTWTNAGCPYVIQNSNLSFNPGTTLTVEAGAVVKMDGMRSLNFDDLVVNGTGGPVTFTSLNDDSVGGDTGADGPTSGTPGDWNGISLVSGATHTLDGLTVSYADTGVVFEGVPGTVDKSSFSRNLTGLSFELGGSAVVTNSSFAGNDTGVNVDASSLPDLGDLNDASPLNDGLNDFVCNTVHVSNANAATVLAENNWWGEAPPNPALIVGSVDYDPYLTGQSQPVLTGLGVSLENGNADVRLAWEDAAPACGYRVLRSEQPDSGFTDESGLLLANTYDDLGAGSSPTDYYYLVVVD